MTVLPLVQALGYPIIGVASIAADRVFGRRQHQADTDAASAQAIKTSVDIMVTALTEAKEQLAAARLEIAALQSHLANQDRAIARMSRRLEQINAFLRERHLTPPPEAEEPEEAMNGRGR
jgi:chromosome segregation ATPase